MRECSNARASVATVIDADGRCLYSTTTAKIRARWIERSPGTLAPKVHRLFYLLVTITQAGVCFHIVVHIDHGDPDAAKHSADHEAGKDEDERLRPGLPLRNLWRIHHLHRRRRLGLVDASRLQLPREQVVKRLVVLEIALLADVRKARLRELSLRQHGAVGALLKELQLLAQAFQFLTQVHHVRILLRG